MKEVKVNKISASKEWLDDCWDLLKSGKRQAASELYRKYGNTVLFPMFLHVDLCQAMHDIFVAAPSGEEAIRFIEQAFDEVKEDFKVADYEK